LSFIAVNFLWITESLLIIIQLSVPGYDNNFVFLVFALNLCYD